MLELKGYLNSVLISFHFQDTTTILPKSRDSMT